MGLQFEDIYGYKHITTNEIARGGQGAVFRTQNPNIAIKVEFDQSGTAFSRDLTQNNRLNEIRLLPIPSKVNLTLPQATLKDIAGYVMTLLDDMDSFESIFDYSFETECEHMNAWLEQFKESAPEFVDVFGQYIGSGGRRRRLNAYLKVATILSELHSKGLVYCDFSSKNAYISKVQGFDAIWLIDADNLNYQEKTLRSGYYTPGYGAPEVINGKGCTFYSDSYAFAISLFWQLTGTHPFKGAAMESDMDVDFADDIEEKANAGELPWIMDQEDDSNYIETRIPQNLIISDRLAKCFERTFSETGKKKRHKRPTMFEWSYTLAKELDRSVKCSFCQMDYDEKFSACPWCERKSKRVILTSRTETEGLWQFVHEVEDNKEIAVPLRLLHGYRTAECEKNAFTLCYKKKTIVLSDLLDSSEWSVSTDGGASYVDVYGKTSIIGKCIVKAVDEGTGNIVYIEVTVHDENEID